MSKHLHIADDSFRMSLIVPKKYHEEICRSAKTRGVLASDVYREAILYYINKELKCQVSQK